MILVPWMSVQAGVSTVSDCTDRIKQAATESKKGTGNTELFWYGETVPDTIRDAKYPISFRKKVIGISPFRYCMELELRPILKVRKKPEDLIEEKPVRLFQPIPYDKTSFRAYLLFDDPRNPSSISADNIKVSGYRISLDEKKKKDDYRGEQISGYLSEMVIVVTIDNDSYFGASKEKRANDPKDTEDLRYWLKDSDGGFVVLCKRDCKKQLQAVQQKLSAAEDKGRLGSKSEEIASHPDCAETKLNVCCSALAAAREQIKGKEEVIRQYDKGPPCVENPRLKIRLHDVDADKLLDEKERATIEVVWDCGKTTSNPTPLSPQNGPTRDELLSHSMQCVQIKSSNYKIQGPATYMPHKQEVTILVKTKAIDLEDVEVEITLASDDPLPHDCAPVLDYYEPNTNRLAKSFRLLGQDILAIDQSNTRIKQLNPHGRLALRFKEGSCKFDPEVKWLPEIKQLLRGNQIRIEERTYLTKPTLHVVFAFDKETTGRVIEEGLTWPVIKAIIEGLNQAVGEVGFYQVKLYSHFQDDDRKRPKPFKTWAAGGFPSATEIHKLSRKPLAESGLSESCELTDRRVERFIRSITDQAPLLDSADPRAVFLFVGRHELNSAAICKSTRGDLAGIEGLLGETRTRAKAVLVDFYKGSNEGFNGLMNAPETQFLTLNHSKKSTASSLSIVVLNRKKGSKRSIPLSAGSSKSSSVGIKREILGRVT